MGTALFRWTSKPAANHEAPFRAKVKHSFLEIERQFSCATERYLGSLQSSSLSMKASARGNLQMARLRLH